MRADEPGIVTYSTKPSFQTFRISHRRHREDVSLDDKFQQHFSQIEMTFSHGLANPGPMRRRTRIDQPLDHFHVTLAERSPDDRRLGMTAWFDSGMILLATACIDASSASDRASPPAVVAEPLKSATGKLFPQATVQVLLAIMVNEL